MPGPRVLVTGASGLIGGLVLRDLSAKYEFSGLSRRPVDGIPHTTADVTDLDAIRPAFQDTDAVLCAGTPEWCARFVPAGWQFVVTGWRTGFALRPADPPAGSLTRQPGR